jgi:hypothetical protein
VKVRKQLFIGPHDFSSRLILYGFCVDGARIIFIENEDIFVSSARSDWEPPILIVVFFTCDFNGDKELMRGFVVGLFGWFGVRLFFLGRTYVLSNLIHVSFGCCFRWRKMSLYSCCG